MERRILQTEGNTHTHTHTHQYIHIAPSEGGREARRRSLLRILQNSRDDYGSRQDRTNHQIIIHGLDLVIYCLAYTQQEATPHESAIHFAHAPLANSASESFIGPQGSAAQHAFEICTSQCLCEPHPVQAGSPTTACTPVVQTANPLKLSRKRSPHPSGVWKYQARVQLAQCRSPRYCTYRKSVVV